MTCDHAVAFDPCRTVCRGALVVFMPAVLYPLINAATHIVQAKRIWSEAADLDRLLGAGNVDAILAIGHTCLQLIAPPVLRLRACSRSIFPFSLTRKSIRLARCARQPSDKLLGITPAHIRYRAHHLCRLP